MKLLLDTHCLIWALVDAPELSNAARATMARAEEVGFSERLTVLFVRLPCTSRTMTRVT